MIIKEYIKYEGLSGENKKIFLAVYTEPKKVLLSDSQVNTIVNTDFNKMMDEIGKQTYGDLFSKKKDN